MIMFYLISRQKPYLILSLTLELSNTNIHVFSLENSVDPDQLASDEAS